MADDLFVFYRNTAYLATTPLGEISLRVDERNELLSLLLQTYDATDWTYLTSDNPGSHLVLESENERQRRALEDSLRRHALTFFRGNSISDRGDWPFERGFLVLGIDQERAIEFAKVFGQNAILAGDAEAIPRLVDCR